ncbi:hypothetical protein ACQPXH_00165 [Nocardia sp. CA-135953]|uniref:hypothetical protein n=1 Tax=Nocardia sp. CA-135953 TaxID=3239978 RepID=UPI003D95E9D3
MHIVAGRVETVIIYRGDQTVGGGDDVVAAVRAALGVFLDTGLITAFDGDDALGVGGGCQLALRVDRKGSVPRHFHVVTVAEAADLDFEGVVSVDQAGGRGVGVVPVSGGDALLAVVEDRLTTRLRGNRISVRVHGLSAPSDPPPWVTLMIDPSSWTVVVILWPN